MYNQQLVAAAAVTVALGLSATPAVAQQSYQFLPDDATNPDTLSGKPPIIVGYANEADWAARVNGTSPRISYVSFSSTPQLSSYNGSVVSYSRTAIAGPVTAYDTSTVTVTNGTTTLSLPYRGGFNALNQSTLNLSGRITISSIVYAADDATVNVSGATFDPSSSGGQIQAYGNSTVNFTGGSMTPPKLYGRSTMNMSGGTVAALPYVYESSTVNISGGTVNGVVNCHGNSTVNITGGSASDVSVYVYQSGTANVSGGSLKNLFGSQDSIVNITGGTFLGVAGGITVNVYGGTFIPDDDIPAFASFWVFGETSDGRGGVLNFFGTDLVLTQTASDLGGVERYLISGTLQDGSVLSDASIHLFTVPAGRPQPRIVLHNIPDPVALPAVLGLGALMGRRRW